MYIGSGQLVPELLVNELAKSLLGERKHTWIQNQKNVASECVEVTKQFLVVTRQDGVVGFILACCEVRLPPGAKIVKGTEKWKYYFFSDFNEAVEVFAWNEVPADCCPNTAAAARSHREKQRQRALENPNEGL